MYIYIYHIEITFSGDGDGSPKPNHCLKEAAVVVRLSLVRTLQGGIIQSSFLGEFVHERCMNQTCFGPGKFASWGNVEKYSTKNHHSH